MFVKCINVSTRRSGGSTPLAIVTSSYINHQSAVNIEQRRESYRPKYQTMKITRSGDVTRSVDVTYHSSKFI